MSEQEEIAKQQIFVNWLKQHKLYNPWESSSRMVRMQRLWEMTQEHVKQKMLLDAIHRLEKMVGGPDDDLSKGIDALRKDYEALVCKSKL